MANVQPGDLALVVDNEHPITKWSLGRVVTIESRCDCLAARLRGPCVWSFVEPLRHGNMMLSCAPDWCLKRIPPLDDLEIREGPVHAVLEA